MQDRHFKRYQSLNLNSSNQIQCSQLYSLTPIGIGTPFIESLTSYIARLALAHCVYPGILMERLVKSVINKKQSSADIHKIYSFTGAINGVGIMALDIVDALAKLTFQDNLFFLTLTNFSELLPSRNLLHNYKKWCPYCYNNWQQNSKTIYEPLIWKLQVVTVCNIHNVALQEFCPRCNRQDYHLVWKTRPGYCSQCHQWLGALEKYNTNLSSQASQDKDKEIKWHLWVGNNLGELLERNSSCKISWFKDRPSKSLIRYAQSENKGNIAAFARQLKMPKNTVWMWCKNKSQPSLEKLLYVCYCLKTSVWDFLAQEDLIDLDKTELFFSPPPLKAKVTRKTFDRDEVKRYLEQALEQKTCSPPSMEQVARELQVDRRTVFRHFPELCKAISAKYSKHRKIMHKQAVRESCHEVQQAVSQLHGEGVYPTENKVEKLLSRPGFLRYKEVKKAFAKAKQKLNL